MSPPVSADTPAKPSPVSRVPFARRRAAHLRLGRRGERLACRLLRRLGLEILLRNYRHGRGEIDIVARDGETLCFVEVKTRRRRGLYDPARAVGRAKKQILLRTARHYLREIGRPPVPHRHDIVELVIPGIRVHYASYHRNAFADPATTRWTTPEPGARGPRR